MLQFSEIINKCAKEIYPEAWWRTQPWIVFAICGKWMKTVQTQTCNTVNMCYYLKPIFMSEQNGMSTALE